MNGTRNRGMMGNNEEIARLKEDVCWLKVMVFIFVINMIFDLIILLVSTK